MAEIKKYLDTTALGTLVEQIKAEDAKALASAKKYTDEAPFDAAGSAATAKSEAIADANAKFEVVNGNIEKKADITALEAEVTRATQKEAELLTAIEATDAIADKNAEDIAAINNAESGILAQAKSFATSEDAKVQANIDAVVEDLAELNTYIGTIPETATATNVVAYVQEKTSGIATSENLQELTNRVAQAETDIDNIEKDYLKVADKSELQGKIDTLTQTHSTDKAALEASIKTISDDYLKTADKTALQDQITANANAITLLSEGVDAEKIDGVKDLINYVEEHGTEVTGMKEDIAGNTSAIEGVANRMTTAEGKITNLETAVSTKCEQSALDEAVEALQGADTAIKGRLDSLEGKLGDAGDVAQDIATAKQEAIDAAAQDATTKANAAETNAKGHADSLNSAMNTRVEALEAVDHSHANKAELDLIATGDKAKWDVATAKAHEHANATELAKIVDGDVAKWNAAEQNAKDYASGLNATMTTKVDGIDTRVGTLETTIVDKAEADDLDAAVERIAKNETDIASLTSSINSFTPITSAEVEALFA